MHCDRQLSSISQAAIYSSNAKLFVWTVIEQRFKHFCRRTALSLVLNAVCWYWNDWLTDGAINSSCIKRWRRCGCLTGAESRKRKAFLALQLKHATVMPQQCGKNKELRTQERESKEKEIEVKSCLLKINIDIEVWMEERRGKVRE